jgi:hypothetical protein
MLREAVAAKTPLGMQARALARPVSGVAALVPRDRAQPLRRGLSCRARHPERAHPWFGLCGELAGVATAGAGAAAPVARWRAAAACTIATSVVGLLALIARRTARAARLLRCTRGALTLTRIRRPRLRWTPGSW